MHEPQALERRDEQPPLARPRFGRDYIIPVPFNPRLIHTIPPAVARAAMETGVARRSIDDMADYAAQLSARRDPVAGALQRIVERSARILGVPTDEAGAARIAGRSRGTPRIANRLLRRVRDFAEVKAQGRITDAVAQAALDLLDTDAAQRMRNHDDG